MDSRGLDDGQLLRRRGNIRNARLFATVGFNKITAIFVSCTMLAACGALSSVVPAGKGDAGSAVQGDGPVLPPVPVSGSYLVTVLTDTRSEPLAQQVIIFDSGRFSSTSDEFGEFKIPIDLIREDRLVVGLYRDGQTRTIELNIPPDILSYVRMGKSESIQLTKLQRIMGVRYSAEDVGGASGEAAQPLTISLPLEAQRGGIKSADFSQFEVLSHGKNDAVDRLFTLSGRCTAGRRIRVSGDVVSPIESECIALNGSGSFSAAVDVGLQQGKKRLFIEQIDTEKDTYVGYLLVLKKLSRPASDLALQGPFSVNGLEAVLVGTCRDSESTEVDVSSSLGEVVEESCEGNALQVKIHLPAGSAAEFEVSVTQRDRSTSTPITVSAKYTRSAFNCPAGYVGVPRSSIDFLGNKLANKTTSAKALNVSRDFCVMKYPAKQNGTIAVSTTGGEPWRLPRGTVGAGGASAFNACSNAGAGHHLMSNTQWQTVARNAESVDENWSEGGVGKGILPQGHTDNNPAGPQANGADSDPYFATGNSPNSGWNQRRTLYLSNGEIVWDFGGNISQIVADDFVGIGFSISSLSDLLGFASSLFTKNEGNRLLVGPRAASDSAGKVYVGSEGLSGTRAIARGSSWASADNGDRGGIFSADFYTTHAALGQGFRCAYIQP